MRDPLRDYPQPLKSLRRTIRNRIVASYRDKAFFDGERCNGYGGFVYDGRWLQIAKNFITDFNLDAKSSVLQLGCEKGFLLHDLVSLQPLMRVRGQETSVYARNCAMKDIRLGIRLNPLTVIPFSDKEFDLVIALGVVYCFNLTDAIKCLKEIQRVGKQAFVTLASYETEEELKLLRDWTLLGTTILKAEEWREVLAHVGFTGDYKLVTAKTLNLCAC